MEMDFFASLRQFDIDLLKFLLILITIGLLIAFLLTALCAPVLAFVTESIFTARRKAFYDKCALQITQVSFGLGLFMFLLLEGGAVLIITENLPELLVPPYLWNILAALGIPLLIVLFTAISLGTWNALKKKRAVHLFVSGMAALCAFLVFFFGVLLLASLQQQFIYLVIWNAPFSALNVLLHNFANAPLLWMMVLYLFAVGIAATTALSQLWLIMRREKADYGRDYYAFAMRYCARIALGFTLLFAALFGFMLWYMNQANLPEFSQPKEPALLLVSGALPLCCCLLWLCIIKSATPLRHKPGAFFAFIFLVASLCAQALAFASAFPMV